MFWCFGARSAVVGSGARRAAPVSGWRTSAQVHANCATLPSSQPGPMTVRRICAGKLTRSADRHLPTPARRAFAAAGANCISCVHIDVVVINSTAPTSFAQSKTFSHSLSFSRTFHCLSQSLTVSQSPPLCTFSVTFRVLYHFSTTFRILDSLDFKRAERVRTFRHHDRSIGRRTGVGGAYLSLASSTIMSTSCGLPGGVRRAQSRPRSQRLSGVRV